MGYHLNMNQIETIELKTVTCRELFVSTKVLNYNQLKDVDQYCSLPPTDNLPEPREQVLIITNQGHVLPAIYEGHDGLSAWFSTKLFGRLSTDDLVGYRDARGLDRNNRGNYFDKLAKVIK